MELTPGTYPLGADQTLNIIAFLTSKASGGANKISFSPPDYTADDTLRFEVGAGGLFVLAFAPAPTVGEMDAALTALGIDPAVATQEQRDLVQALLKTIELGG
jgi:hypothetical protein